jgi:glycosyltransferase involved in cell wall biosynthesis
MTFTLSSMQSQPLPKPSGRSEDWTAEATKGPLTDKADSIYFLMWDGWAHELRSNRWHYASRWARHLPVVLVQPCLGRDSQASVVETEPRIPNCSILRVRDTSPEAGGAPTSALLQARQIHAHMVANGHHRSILWIYNANCMVASALVPAVARVYHATENYFSFDEVSRGFLDLLRGVLADCDLVIAVSEGVAAAHRAHAAGRVEVVTNGCDYPFYARAGEDAELCDARRGFEKVAAYAGNINNRLDFELIEHCARACPRVLFAFFGPVAGLSSAETRQWARLLAAPNLRYLGAVDVSRLPAIYGTADLGIIPYRSIPSVVDNIFPLKAFEMQSAGLPVVSIHLKALTQHASASLRIAKTVDEFVAAVRSASRQALPPVALAAMDAASREQDYDEKFRGVLALVAETIDPDAPAKSKEPKWVGSGSSGASMEIGRGGVMRRPPLPVRMIRVVCSERNIFGEAARALARRVLSSSLRRRLVDLLGLR